MKNLSLKKWGTIFLISLFVLFVIFGIAIPFSNSLKESAIRDIEYAVSELENCDIDKETIDDFKACMKDVANGKWKKEKFDALLIEQISETHGGPGNTGFQKAIYDISAKQILLEAAGYKSKAVNKAFNEQLQIIWDFYIEHIEFKDFINSLIEEPYPTDYQDEKIYDTTLKYYTFPKTVFLSEYLPGYIANLREKAFNSKSTEDLISLSEKFSAICNNEDIDATELMTYSDIDKIIDLLTTDAEEIIVRDGEGGYYDGNKFEASRKNKSDKLFDQVASTVTGSDVKSNSFNFKSTNYYGDLASAYSESGLAYSYTDEEGKKKHKSNTKSRTRLVYLKGEIIHEGDSISDALIKLVREEGMANYHKDGICFAVGNDSIVYYVGKKTFSFDYSKI